VNPSGLTASATPYTGSFTVTTTAGSQTITVNLLVSASPVLQSSPGDIVYSAPNTTYSLSVYASDFSAQSAAATTTDNWVTLGNAQISGTQTTYSVTLNTAGLCNGINVANITVNTSAANNPLVVPVVALISGAPTNCGTGGGTLIATPNTLTFNYQQGTQAPVAQTVSVTSSTGSAVSFTVTATSQGNWLAATPVNGATSTPATVSVSISPSGLQPSMTPYTGTVTLTPSSGNPTTISVSLTVTPGASLVVSPTTLTFSNVQAGGATTSQTLSVTGASGATFSATSDSPWLTVSPTSGSVPNTLTVTVNPANLAANATPYIGNITISGTGNTTGSTTVSVSATVTAPLPTISKIGNAASFVVGALAPGEVIYLEGTALGPQTLVTAAVDPATGKLATTIGGVSITVGGFAAPMVYASANKVSAIVPYELKGFSTATVLLKYLGQTSNGITFGVATTAPGVFTANASGTGPAAALNPDLSGNAPSTPAPKGSQVAVFVTGEGETNPAGVTGKITVPNLSGVGTLTPVPLLQVTVLVDGQPAKAINYVGEVAGIVAGVLQVNFTIPDNARTGDLPLLVSVGGNVSQQGVTISVK
jgi:uncharacterized protein (TIGR03437 family)